MPTLHLPEILLIVVILLLVFGVGRIAKIGGELGAGIKAFKDGLSGKLDDKDSAEEKEQASSDNK
jgi:sec-independent protein translocase protein TatA